MAAPVISHQRPRRKRGAWRRIAVPAVTLAGLSVATWIAPYLYPPLRPAEPAPIQQAAAPSPKLRDMIKVMTRGEPSRPAHARLQRTPRSSAPLDTAPAYVPDEFEVLSPAELDAISQARD